MKLMQSIPAPKYIGPILQLAKYTVALDPTPSKVYWEYKVPAWGMDANDTIGDCEIARIAHMVMNFTAHTGTMVTPTIDEVIAVYSAITGYDPSQTQPDGTNPTDTGAATPDVMNYWQNTGIAGHKIAGWVQTDLTQAAIEQAIWLFGGDALDIAVYQSMMDQTNAGKPWDNPSGDALGYHAVPAFGFGSQGLTLVTWGALQQMGWPTAMQVAQGSYAAFGEDWLNAGKAPNGFDMATLQADLAAMASQQ